MCDANYRFLFVDIGAFGRRSDGGIFADSILGQLFRCNRMNVPCRSTIGDTTSFEFPYVMIADEAFPLEEWMMRPYPKSSIGSYERVYNYRLSRARRTIENAFGILVARWRIFRCPIATYVETAENIVKSCICLHNWLLQEDEKISNETEQYITPGLIDVPGEFGSFVEGSWRSTNAGALNDTNRLGTNNYSDNADKIRENFCSYFNEEGNLWWQHLYT